MLINDVNGLYFPNFSHPNFEISALYFNMWESFKYLWNSINSNLKTDLAYLNLDLNHRPCEYIHIKT